MGACGAIAHAHTHANASATKKIPRAQKSPRAFADVIKKKLCAANEWKGNSLKKSTLVGDCICNKECLR